MEGGSSLRDASRGALCAGALVLACGALILGGGDALAQAPRDLKPAPYVPTPQEVVDTMLELAQVGPRDYVIDLGSGDGRLVITAAKRHGARGLGVDLDATLIDFSRRYAREQGVGERARFRREDLFKTDLRAATVLTLYLLPDMLLALRPRLLEVLRPGTRIVTHDFDFGAWRPDEHLTIPVPGKPVGPAPQSDIYLWVVPAAIAGEWRGTLGTGAAARRLRLAIDQQFQEFALDAYIDDREASPSATRLRGTRVGFTLDLDGRAIEFAGELRGDAITGTASAVGERWPWRVTRPAAPAKAAAAGSRQ